MINAVVSESSTFDNVASVDARYRNEKGQKAGREEKELSHQPLIKIQQPLVRN